MRRRWRAAVLLAFLAGYPCAATEAPTVRPLDPATEETTPPADNEPARSLPVTVAVCRDAAAPRCWTAPRAEDCDRDGARVFRVVIGDARGTDALTALAECRMAPETATGGSVPAR